VGTAAWLPQQKGAAAFIVGFAQGLAERPVERMPGERPGSWDFRTAARTFTTGASIANDWQLPAMRTSPRFEPDLRLPA
jgi:hypothetical protein